MLPPGILALLIADTEWDPGLWVERIGVVLLQYPGFSLTAGTLGSLGRQNTWHERAEDEHNRECPPTKLHVPFSN